MKCHEYMAGMTFIYRPVKPPRKLSDRQTAKEHRGLRWPRPIRNVQKNCNQIILKPKSGFPFPWGFRSKLEKCLTSQSKPVSGQVEKTGG